MEKPGRRARFLTLMVTALIAATLPACSEESTQPTNDPPPPLPPPPAGRPVDPGLSFNLGCVHEGEITNPVDGGGGTPGIPVLINPGFVTVANVDYLQATDIVFGVELEGRFYTFPVRIMNYHEIASFTVVEGRYAATWCPLSFSFVLVENDAWDASTPAKIASPIPVRGPVVRTAGRFASASTRSEKPSTIGSKVSNAPCQAAAFRDTA